MESDNRFVMGADGDDELGDTGGAKEHTLTIEEMPRHRHTFDNPSSSNSGSNASPRARVDQDSGSSGSGNAHNNLPPYRMFYRIIKLERSLMKQWNSGDIVEEHKSNQLLIIKGTTTEI